MNFKVTHYMRRPAERDSWIPLAFLTRSTGALDGTFFWGFESQRVIRADDVRARERAGTFRKLDFEYQVRPGQLLWLSPENDVWLASETDPIGDAHKLLVDRGPARGIPLAVWELPAGDDALRESLMAQRVIETGRLPYLSGDYLNSKRHPGKVFEPVWQERIKECGLERIRGLAQKLNVDRKIIELPLQAQEHRYQLVQRLILNNKLALPFEMIFLTPDRRESIDVVHFGNVADLALVYPNGGRCQTALELTPDTKYCNQFDVWIRAIQDAKVNICAPTDTSAEHVLLDEIAENRLSRVQKQERSTIRDLLIWIKSARTGEKQETRVILCDVGIAHQLLRRAKSQDLTLAMSFVPYPAPIPVGLAYRRSDVHWGRFISGIVQDVVRSSDERVQKSLAETSDLASEVHMTWEIQKLAA